MTRKKYIPERNYYERGFKPFKAPLPDLCGHCKDYYRRLYEQGITNSPFPPKCEGHVANPIARLRVEDFPSEEEYFNTITDLDPVSWAMKEFGWEARFYQQEVLSCTSKYKVIRQGRRSGKTEGAVVGILHKVFTNSNYPVLIVAPYESQINVIFEIIDKFVGKSERLQNSLERKHQRPQLRQLSNGSVIKGFCAGAGSSSKSDKIRGQDAKLIYADEFDYIPDKELEAIIAIIMSHPDVNLWATSTPTGEHKRFYHIVVNKDLGYKEFWYTSMENPHWDAEMEAQLRREYNAEKSDTPMWVSEVLADFGVQQDGVFLNHYIDQALEDYSIEEERFPRHDRKYVLGVDWNETAGTHTIIVETDGTHFRPIQKIIIPQSEFTQTKSVEKILQLHRKWQFCGIYIDAGFGSVQIELLKKAGAKERRLRMDKVLKAFTMQKMIEIRDPIDGSTVRKHTKPFLVNTLANALAEGLITLPRSEDTSESKNSPRMGLVQQMRNFKVESYSSYGLPKYSQGQEHTLTAFMLAVSGYILHHSDLSKINYSSRISVERLVDVPEDKLRSDIINEIIREQVESEMNRAHMTVTTNSPEVARRTLKLGGRLRNLGGGSSRRNL
ncbi:MAG: hypothetical protein D6698_06800 [Gammaproteobacteria bacterium]|nr:MAG: hypothetical protein D6698_06800 [Gammaproteobacteria bacterium]